MSPEDELKATLSFELGQIRKELAVLDRMAGPRKRLGPDEVKVRAAASSLHSIYNGIEKMLETVLKSKGQALTTGPSSHADLLDAVVVADGGSLSRANDARNGWCHRDPRSATAPGCRRLTSA